jgi:hypothetical protein
MPQIKINEIKTESTNSLDNIVSDKFERNTFRYPLNVGNAEYGHYVIFYIRTQAGLGGAVRTSVGKAIDNYRGVEQVNNKFGMNRTGINLQGVNLQDSMQNIAKNFGGTLLNNVVNNSGINNYVNVLPNATFGNDISPETSQILNNSITKIKGSSIFSGATTKLTTDAIALYMPDTLMFQHSQGYASADIGKELGGKIMGSLQSAVNAFKENRTEANANAIKAAFRGAQAASGNAALSVGGKLAEQLGKATVGENTTKLGMLAILGGVSNPMLELIYTGPNFRSFSFTFDFYPRSEKEALEVQRIIERLRYHQAPRKLGGNLESFLEPPSQFDIKFYYAGKENPNIPPITEDCVLKSINVNYAPSGFKTYEVPGRSEPSYGQTGMPVHINLQLEFQETKYLTKEDFNKDLI